MKALILTHGRTIAVRVMRRGKPPARAAGNLGHLIRAAVKIMEPQI